MDNLEELRDLSSQLEDVRIEQGSMRSIINDLDTTEKTIQNRINSILYDIHKERFPIGTTVECEGDSVYMAVVGTVVGYLEGMVRVSSNLQDRVYSYPGTILKNKYE